MDRWVPLSFGTVEPMPIIYRRQTHAVYHTKYHIVFTTKFRRKLLKGGMGRYLTYLVKSLERQHPEI
ncbi:MAG: hypothetical protein WAT81_05010 [Candidatus Moraniibacteriota bacterium]